jgi:hypothetical protein
MNSRTKFSLPEMYTPNFSVPGVHILPADNLHVAAALGYINEMQGLLEQQPQLANQPHSSEGTIPLCWALQNQQTLAVALLIDYSHQPRVAPLPHNSPLYYLNPAWAKANPELTKKLLNNTQQALDFVYNYALHSLTSLELATLIQNYLLLVKHGNGSFLFTINMSVKINSCLKWLYVSNDFDGNKAFYTLSAWINLSVCKPMLNGVGKQEAEIIRDVVKTINLDDENFYLRFIRALGALSPRFNDSIITSNQNGIVNSHLCRSFRANAAVKRELALILFDAADHEANSDLAEKLYGYSREQNATPQFISSMQDLADLVNNANPHLTANAILALQDETDLNNFKAAIVLRMLIQAGTDRKMNHLNHHVQRLIVSTIEKAIGLIGRLTQRNNHLGDLFELAGDVYLKNFLLRFDDVYPSEPLKSLYSTAASLQVNPISLQSTRRKLLEISITDNAIAQQPSLPSIAGLFSNLRIREVSFFKILCFFLLV